MLSWRTRRLILIGLPTTLTLLWLAYVLGGGHLDRVLSHWRAALTMVFGGFVAGSTPQGGGAVAFPVFTKLLEMPADNARTFSLCIQTVGMGTASLAILLSGKKIEKGVVLAGGGMGIVGLLTGLFLFGDSTAPYWPSNLPGPYVKVTFTIMLAVLAYIVYLALDEGACGEFEMPHWNRRIWTGMLLAGFVGGLAASLVGSGVDVMIFLFVVIMAGLHPRVGVPSSVLAMAMVSIAGFITLGVLDGQLATQINAAGEVISVGGFAVQALPSVQYDIFGMWLAAAPVVMWSAPLGTVFVHFLNEKRLILFLAAMATAEVVSTAIFLEDLRTNRALLAYALVGSGAAIVAITYADKHKSSLLGIPAYVYNRNKDRRFPDPSHGLDDL